MDLPHQQPHHHRQRDIDRIVIHCTATPRNTSIESIKNYWKYKLNWNNPGYHIIIEESGEIVYLTDCFCKIVNGVKGFNRNSIHIATIGGKFKDDRTKAQKASLHMTVIFLKECFPNASIIGHHDLNPNKECPRYDVKKEFNYLSTH
jgi:N-acetylmuramoyl-L-alanine amidase